MVAPQQAFDRVGLRAAIDLLDRFAPARNLGLRVSALHHVVVPPEHGRKPGEHRDPPVVLIRRPVGLEENRSSPHVLPQPHHGAVFAGPALFQVPQTVERRAGVRRGVALERAAHGGDRRERGRNGEHHGKRAEGEGPVDEPSPATPPEEQDGGRDREEQPGLEANGRDSRSGPVIDEEALRKEHEEKRGRHEREREPPLRGVPKSRGRDEEEEDADSEQDVDPAHPEQDQAEKREREEDPPNRPAPSPPRHRLVSRRESPCERQEEEEAEDRQDVDPGRASSSSGRFLSGRPRRTPEGAAARSKAGPRRPSRGREARGQRNSGKPRRAERHRTGKERRSPARSGTSQALVKLTRAAPDSEKRGRDGAFSARSDARSALVRTSGRAQASRKRRSGMARTCVQVGEDEAPEGVLVDRVPDDPARGPEIVPVERPLVEEPFAEPGEIAEDRGQGPRGDRGGFRSGPVAREGEGRLERRPPSRPNARLKVYRVESPVTRDRNATISCPKV